MTPHKSNQNNANVLLQDLENAVATGDENLAGRIEQSFQTLGDNSPDDLSDDKNVTD